ncbi:2Fe-2S iron-sulfur cluster binding domain-containing protein, partial [Salmonella enterica subsp. enterica serovar Mbandaka]|nr:2Fe-2S iron-sulfur cluster binding domain-containing protein [Salmonella enterica subsp. enterica serovar Mbandaka]
MSHIIKIFPSNIEFSGREDESILDAALSAGIHLEHSCKAGDCGICESDLLAGEVVDSKGNIFGQGDKILTCCCKPKTALELNAHFFPELAGQTKKIVPCKVDSAVLVSGDVMTLKLRTPPTAKIGFLPGQYVNLHYKGVTRSYSIANSDESNGIELHVRNVPNGQMSSLI